MKPYLSIIIPVYNEERRLDQCLYRLMPHIVTYNTEIIVVNNGSTDKTRQALDVLQGMYRPLRVIHLEERGKGRAVRAGMLAARGRYRYMCDVDLSTPPKEIHRFVEKARVFDVVIGSREIDTTTVKTNLKRRIIGRAFHLLVSGLLPGIRDTQCGFKMFRDEAAERIFNECQITGWAFDVEALTLASQHGYSIHEMPVTWTQDADSRVRIVEDSLVMFFDILKLTMRTRTDVQLGTQ